MTLIKVRKTFVRWAKVPAALIASQGAIGFSLHLFPLEEGLPCAAPWYNYWVFTTTVTVCFSVVAFALFSEREE